MALITDAIDNKVATVDWVCNRLTTDGYAVQGKQLVFNVSIKYGSYTATANATYTLVGRVDSNTTIGNYPNYFIFKVTSVSQISNQATLVNKPGAVELWKDLTTLYVSYDNYPKLLTSNSANVPDILCIKPNNYWKGQTWLTCSVRNIMTSQSNKAYLSVFNLRAVTDTSDLHLYVNHSGCELGENYIGGSKGIMFTTSAGNSIPNDSTKCILDNEYRFYDGINSNKTLLQTEVRDSIIDNFIYPVFGSLYSSKTSYSSGNLKIYGLLSDSNLKIIPPYISGTSLYNGSSVISVKQSFLCSNSTTLFNNLASIPYEPTSMTTRAYFGNIHYGIKRNKDTSPIFFGAPSDDGSLSYTTGFGKDGRFTILPDAFTPGEKISFFDDFNRRPYLNPSILTGIAPTSANYVERHVVQYPTIGQVYSKYYHPTLVNNTLSSLGWTVSSYALGYNLSVPIIVVPSTIYTDDYSISSTTVDKDQYSSTSFNFNTFEPIEIWIYDFAYGIGVADRTYGAGVSQGTIDYIISALNKSKILVQTYQGGGSPSKTETFNLSDCFTLSANVLGGNLYYSRVILTPKSKFYSVNYGGYTYTDVDIVIDGSTVSLDSTYFLTGAVTTSYRTTNSNIKVANFYVAWTGTPSGSATAVSEMGEYE